TLFPYTTLFRSVGIVGEEDIGISHFSPTLQNFGPDGTFFPIPGDHVLHPRIGHGHSMGQLLDGVPLGAYFQKFLDVLVLYGQVWGKTSTTYRPLAHHIHHGLEQLHDMNGPGGLSIVLDRSTPMPDLSKITGSPPAEFGHHSHLGLCK